MCLADLNKKSRFIKGFGISKYIFGDGLGWFGDGLSDGLGGRAVVVWAMVCDGLGDGLGGCVVYL